MWLTVSETDGYMDLTKKINSESFPNKFINISLRKYLKLFTQFIFSKLLQR